MRHQLCSEQKIILSEQILKSVCSHLVYSRGRFGLLPRSLVDPVLCAGDVGRLAFSAPTLGSVLGREHKLRYQLPVKNLEQHLLQVLERQLVSELQLVVQHHVHVPERVRQHWLGGGRQLIAKGALGLAVGEGIVIRGLKEGVEA